MSVGYIIAGLVFLFNPNMNIIDLLPDFIGYALILRGILKASRVNSAFGLAAERFRNLFILEAVKLISLYSYTLVGKSEYIYILLISSVFIGFEIYWGVGAWYNLFKGISLTVSGKDEGYYKRIDRVRRYTFATLIVKSVLCILPDLSLLAGDQYGIVDESRSVASLWPVFTVIAALISLVYCIVWLIIMIGYFRGVRNDKSYLDSLDELYRINYIEDTKKVAYGRLMLICTLLVPAAVFSLELYFNGINYMIPIISALLYFAIFLRAKVFTGKTAVYGTVASVSFAVISLASWIFTYLFSHKYYREDDYTGFSTMLGFLIEDDGAKSWFIIRGILITASELAFAAVAVCLFIAIKKISTGHAGIAPDDEHISVTEQMRAHMERADSEIHKELGKLNKATLVFAVLSTLSAIYFAFGEPYTQVYYIPNTALRVVWMIIFIQLSLKLKAQIKNKYGQV